MNIQWVPSPNYWEGRTKPITTIVLHWIVGTLATADGVFENASSELSAHYGIENETIHQYVKDENTAFHAISANPYSIGIEHSAAPNRPASQATIDTSAQLVRSLCLKHNIPIDRAHIIKHSDVVATQCPGTLPIDEIINKAKEGGEMFNEGDRQNICGYLYNSDPGQHKDVVGKPWKEAMYGILESAYYKQESRVNQGDVGNMSAAKDATGQKGKTWKKAAYDFLIPNQAPSEYVETKVYVKKG